MAYLKNKSGPPAKHVSSISELLPYLEQLGKDEEDMMLEHNVLAIVLGLFPDSVRSYSNCSIIF